MANNRLSISFDDAELKKVINQLSGLADNRQRKAILRKGARVAVPYIERQTPKKGKDKYATDNLRKSIGDITFRRSRDYFATFLIKKAERDPFYAAFQNEGFTHFSGKFVNKHQGFIDKAVKAATPSVQEKLRDEVNEFIRKNKRP